MVTGKGSHSSGGVAKIKPAVLEYLDKKGYRYDINVCVVLITAVLQS